MTNQKAILFITSILLLSGCAHRQGAEDMIREQKEVSQMASVGLQNYYYTDYVHTDFAKRHDVAGYIKFHNEQTRQKKEAEVEAYKKALPSITEKVRVCVFKGHNNPETCFSQLTDSEKSHFTTRLLFDAAGKSVIEDRKQEMLSPIIKELQAARQEKADEEFTAVILKVRAREQQQAEAKRQAAKRAYDSSIQSLVE